ncbi:ABC transporter permease subunit [Roseibium sp. RKSG952]|nr:ABC transporter permease subunit [Roseibium sp. RKSG952]
MGNLVPALVVLVLGAPVAAGLIWTILPAFGYLPALGGTAFSLRPFADLLAAPGIWTSVALSFGTGLAATLLSLVIVLLFTGGWLGTAAFARLSRFLSPLLSVPHAAAAFGLAFLIAPSGFVMRLLSPWATGMTRPPDVLIVQDPLGLTMTLGLILKEVPFLLLMTLAAVPQARAQDLSRAAQSLGYGRMTAFFKVVLPRLYPQIRLPVLAVLAFSTSVVDVAQILGPTTPAPLAPRLLGWMADPDPALRLQASAAAVLQLGVSFAAIMVWMGLERAAAFWIGRSNRTGHRGGNDRALRVSALALAVVTAALTLAGLGVLGLWSLSRGWWFPDAMPSTLTFAHWLRLETQGLSTLWQTLAIALPVTFCSLVIVIALLESRTRTGRAGSGILRKIVFLPLLVPQISFLFGLQVLGISTGLSGTLTGVALAHAVFVLPYVYLALADPWQHIDPRYAQVAASLGASPRKILFRLRLPVLLRPLLVTFAIGAAVSIGQYLPTVMIGAGRVVTVTSESVALASGGNRSLIAVYAVMQLLLPFFLFLLASLIPGLAHRNRALLRPQRHMA